MTELCAFLLSLTIVGAYETRPGIMYLQYLQDGEIEEIYVYEDNYIQCLEQPVDVSEPGTDDAGGGSTPSDT